MPLTAQEIAQLVSAAQERADGDGWRTDAFDQLRLDERQLADLPRADVVAHCAEVLRLDEVETEALAEVAKQFRFDSRETAYFMREFEHLKARTYDVRYPTLRAREFLPVSREASPTAESITYRQWDAAGMAAVIAHWSDDLPNVDVFAKEFTAKVKDIGDSYGYSQKEIKRSAESGRNIPGEKARVARMMIERRLDDIGAFGIPEMNIRGLLNHPNVSIATLPQGTWASATAEQILNDMRYLASEIVENTNEVERPNTMLLPTALYELVAGKVAGSDLAETVLSIFLRTNPHITSVQSWVKLNTAGADGGPRIVCYRRDPEVLELEIPLEFEQLPPEARNLGFVVNCTAATAGVVLRAPLAVVYADNAA